MSFSPDGCRLLFTQVQPDPQVPGNTLPDGTLFMNDTAGGSAGAVGPVDAFVSADGAWGNDASWSPDGSQVAYVSFPADGAGAENTVYVVDAAGTGQRRKLLGGAGYRISAQWSPDGAWIATDGGPSDASGVIVIHPDGTGLTSLVQAKTVDGRTIRPAASCCAVWSPDGAKLLFQAATGAQAVDLFTMNADGCGLAQLTHDPGYYDWYGWAP